MKKQPATLKKKSTSIPTPPIPLSVSVVRLGPLITELRLLRAELSRFADLKELELAKVHGISSSQTTPAELAATRVSYTDPEYTEFAGILERKMGRPLTDEESANILSALSDLPPDEEV